MFKKLSILGVSAVAFFLLVSPVSAAADHLKLSAKGQLNAKACDNEGKVIINVDEKVIKDADSGFAGNYWAFDNYTRHIKVWQTDDNGPTTWCASLTYDGDFDAVAGQTGPGGTGTIGANVGGEFHGGYRATFTGTLKASPLWKTHGSVGVVNYNCDLSANCPGYVDWSTQYFDNVSNFAQPWWGWIYKADHKHGTWLNEINVLSADSGNIL